MAFLTHKKHKRPGSLSVAGIQGVHRPARNRVMRPLASLVLSLSQGVLV